MKFSAANTTLRDNCIPGNNFFINVEFIKYNLSQSEFEFISYFHNKSNIYNQFILTGLDVNKGGGPVHLYTMNMYWIIRQESRRWFASHRHLE